MPCWTSGARSYSYAYGCSRRQEPFTARGVPLPPLGCATCRFGVPPLPEGRVSRSCVLVHLCALSGS